MVHSYLALSSPTAYGSGMTIVGWPLWVEAADGTDNTAIENNDGS